MTEGSKRDRLQSKLDEGGFVPSQRYADRDGETLAIFYGRAGEGASRLPTRSVSGTFYRVSAHDLPVRPGDPALAAGRFHPKGEPTPLYASSSLSTAISEITKHLVLTRHELPVKWRVTKLEVDRLRVAEVVLDSTVGRQASREYAMSAAASGADGLLVRSAADEAVQTLVVFAHALDQVTAIGSEIGMEITEDVADRLTLEFQVNPHLALEFQVKTQEPEREPELEQLLALLSGSYV